MWFVSFFRWVGKAVWGTVKFFGRVIRGVFRPSILQTAVWTGVQGFLYNATSSVTASIAAKGREVLSENSKIAQVPTTAQQPQQFTQQPFVQHPYAQQQQPTYGMPSFTPQFAQQNPFGSAMSHGYI